MVIMLKEIMAENFPELLNISSTSGKNRNLKGSIKLNTEQISDTESCKTSKTKKEMKATREKKNYHKGMKIRLQSDFSTRKCQESNTFKVQRKGKCIRTLCSF